MVAHKALKVKAAPGILCPAVPLQMKIEYIGRKYDPAADPKDIEAEFKPCGEVEIPSTPLYRRAVAAGDLLPADAETAKQCGVKFVTPSKTEIKQ